jgi:ribose transport system substrate-binding protein
MTKRRDDTVPATPRRLTRRELTLSALATGGALLAGGTLLSGCGGQSTTPPTGAPTGTGAAPTGNKTTVTYAVIPKMLNNPFFDVAHNGAKKAKRDLEAADPNLEVKIEYQSSPTGKAQEQVEIIRQLIQRKVDGLAISVIDENATRDVIDEAVAAGIPTMCWDSDCASSKRATFYSVNDAKLGAELARQLLIACGGKLVAGDKIALISGQASAPNLQARTKGVLGVLNESPGIKVLPTLFCDDKGDLAKQQIDTTMAAHPDLRGWVMVGGWALFVDNALEGIRDPKRTKVISTDALEPEWQYLESGQCQVLVAQRPFAYGEESIKILDNLRTGKKTDYPSVQEAPYDLVYKDATPEQKSAAEKNQIKAYSLSEYKEQWAEWSKQG